MVVVAVVPVLTLRPRRGGLAIHETYHISGKDTVATHLFCLFCFVSLIFKKNGINFEHFLHICFTTCIGLFTHNVFPTPPNTPLSSDPLRDLPCRDICHCEGG